MDVVIIDYKMSNLHSVHAACKKVGINSHISSEPKDRVNSKVAILPGVGAFGEAMSQIKDLRLISAIKDFLNTGRPFFGICLGMQLLFESSDEFGFQKGLGIIPGKVKKFKLKSMNNQKYPVPQVGWNQIKKEKLSWQNTPLSKNMDNFILEIEASSNRLFALTKSGINEIHVNSYSVLPTNFKLINDLEIYDMAIIEKDSIYLCSNNYYPDKIMQHLMQLLITLDHQFQSLLKSLI